MKKQEFVNKIKVSGKIIKIKKSPNNDSDRITILSKNGRDVFLHFTCPAGILPPNAERSRVRVEGHIESRPSRPPKGRGKMTIYQEFIADSITLMKTQTEEYFNEKGRFYDTYECRAYLKGTLLDTKEESDWVRYTISVGTKDDKLPVTIRVSMKKIDRMPKLENGDTVCIVGSFSTPLKDIDGGKRAFENIIVFDIAKSA